MAKRKQIKLVQPQPEPIEHFIEGESIEEPQALPMAGVGDVVKKITSALGIAQCENCKKRQEKYNKMFPFLRANRALTPDEEEFILDIASRSQMESDEANRLFALYNEIFPSRSPVRRCNCPGLILTLINRIKNIIETKLD